MRNGSQHMEAGMLLITPNTAAQPRLTVPTGEGELLLEDGVEALLPLSGLLSVANFDLDLAGRHGLHAIGLRVCNTSMGSVLCCSELLASHLP